MRCRIFILCLAALLASGCATGTTGVELPAVTSIQPGTSKVEVYQRLGVPAQIVHRGDQTALVYTRQIRRGMSVRVGGAVLPLRLVDIGNSHQAGDAILILFDENDQVIRAEASNNAKLVRWSLWPGG